MNRLLFLAASLLLLIPANLPAQTIGSFHTLRIAPLGISYSYERALSPATVLITEPGVAFSYQGSDSRLKANLYLNLEPRWYYNLGKRAEMNKNVSLNSSNYIGVSFFTGFQDFEFSKSASNIGCIPKWGIRRPVSGSFFWGIDIGLMFYKNLSEGGIKIQPFPGIRIGWVANSRK